MAEITLKQLADEDQLERFVVEDAADKIAAFHMAAPAIDPKLIGDFADTPLCTEVYRERAMSGCIRAVQGRLGLRDLFVVNGEVQLRREPGLPVAQNSMDLVDQLTSLLRELVNLSMQSQANILFNRYFDVTGGVINDPYTLTSLGVWLNSGVAAGQQPPKLIAVGGLSGGGKSRMARMLAPHFECPAGARVVRTDVVRKRMMGTALSERLQSHGYAEDKTVKTYQLFYDEIRRVLEQGHSAIADGVFAMDEQRIQVEQVARKIGVPFVGLWVDAPPEIRSQRVAARRNNVSDVTEEVLKRQLSYDLGDINWNKIDSSGPKEATLYLGRKFSGV